MAESIRKAGVRANAGAQNLGPHHRLTRRVCPKKRQDLPLVKDREGRGPGIRR